LRAILSFLRKIIDYVTLTTAALSIAWKAPLHFLLSALCFSMSVFLYLKRRLYEAFVQAKVVFMV
ncbi:MAG: hypothetical protein PUE85_02120, partial [Firmicutes bacterium]|nr:hypothetical protein [Bacillota bacterium]